MRQQLVKYFFIAILLGIGWFLSTYHIIIQNRNFYTLKKPYLTFEYTFYNITNRDPEDIMRVDMLRESDIGELLVELGLLSETQAYRLEDKYGYEDEEEGVGTE